VVLALGSEIVWVTYNLKAPWLWGLGAGTKGVQDGEEGFTMTGSGLPYRRAPGTFKVKSHLALHCSQSSMR
jgi:hypothetical protein